MRKLLLTIVILGGWGTLVFTTPPGAVYAQTQAPQANQPAATQVTPKAHVETLTGVVTKSPGGGFVLEDRDNNNLSYQLDDANLDFRQKLAQFENQKVKVTGVLDAADDLLHVESIQPVP